MPRPIKQVVDYFPHMVSHGKTLLILRNDFGNDGYSFWFSLLELLCKSEGQYYDYNTPAAWRLLLAETHVKEETAKQILDILCDIEAIDKELFQKKIIWVQNLVDNLAQVYDRRATGKPLKPVIADNKPTKKGITVDGNEVNDDNNPASKLNNTKLNNTKQVYGEFHNVKLTDDELMKLKTRFGDADCQVKIEELSEGLASKGYKYSSHYATILSWARKHEKEKAAGGSNGAHQGYPAAGKKQYTKPPNDDLPL